MISLNKKVFIKNKNLVWTQTRKNARLNLKNKLKSQFRSLKFKTRIIENNNHPLNYYFFLLQYLIKKGNKYKMEILFKKSLLFWIQNYSNKKFSNILETAFNNLIPHVGVITKRKGSKNIFIPYKLSKKKTFFFGIKWLLTNALLKKKKYFYEGIFEELIECSSGSSSSIKKKEEMLKLAEENLYNLKRKR